MDARLVRATIIRVYQHGFGGSKRSKKSLSSRLIRQAFRREDRGERGG